MLATVIERIQLRKQGHKFYTASLLVNQHGKAMSKQMVCTTFEKARTAATAQAKQAGNARLAADIEKFWFYDLRAKAADDVAKTRGEQDAAKQLGHASVQTTKRHYLRRGAKVKATK